MRRNERGLLTPITICSFLNWNLVKGAVSTARQNKLVITEREKKKACKTTKSMFLSVIWWCSYSFEGLNSIPGAYRLQPAIQLHCASKKQHLHVVTTKAISGNHPEDPKASTSSHRKQTVVQLFKFPRIAKHFSPATRLFLSVLIVLYLHGLHHLYPHTEYQSSPSMKWQAAFPVCLIKKPQPEQYWFCGLP